MQNVITSKCNTFFMLSKPVYEMPFGVPIVGVSLLNCCRFVPSALRNNLIGGGAALLEKCDVIVVTIRTFSR